MSYFFDNGDEGFELNISGWNRISHLGIKYGWEPKGTTINQQLDPPWEGGYFTNDCQIINKNDAWNLAGALERYLLDNPHDTTVADFITFLYSSNDITIC